ncbi:hypothetical protein TNCV_2077201 [Trichonephila clavipes]|nr:hypothetical protein TNCV_2077201 [Trichonephila clavipes]
MADLMFISPSTEDGLQWHPNTSTHGCPATSLSERVMNLNYEVKLLVNRSIRYSAVFNLLHCYVKYTRTQHFEWHRDAVVGYLYELVPTSREDGRLGVIGKVLAYRSERKVPRTNLPSFIGDPGRDMNRTLRPPQSWRHLSNATATNQSNIDANKPLLLKVVLHK